MIATERAPGMPGALFLWAAPFPALQGPGGFIIWSGAENGAKAGKNERSSAAMTEKSVRREKPPQAARDREAS
jgi:hypothetical protein